MVTLASFETQLANRYARSVELEASALELLADLESRVPEPLSDAISRARLNAILKEIRFQTEHYLRVLQLVRIARKHEPYGTCGF